MCQVVTRKLGRNPRNDSMSVCYDAVCMGARDSFPLLQQQDEKRRNPLMCQL